MLETLSHHGGFRPERPGPLAAAAAYARHKESYLLPTTQSCQAQGARFIPMVAENTGAWDALAASSTSWLLVRSPLQELSISIRSLAPPRSHPNCLPVTSAVVLLSSQSFPAFPLLNKIRQQMLANVSGFSIA